MVDKAPINLNKLVMKFIIVIVILGVLFIGAVQSVRQRGEQVRREQAIAQVEDKERTKETETSKNTTDNQANDKTNNSPDSSVATSDDLPATGATEVFINALALGCLMAGVSSYLLSAKKLSSSL